MGTHINQTKKRKNQSETNLLSKGESNLHFDNNRPEAQDQEDLQKIANTSAQVSQLGTFQKMLNKKQRAINNAQLSSIGVSDDSLQQLPLQKKANKTGLPDELKSGIENISGYNMDDVRVHFNSEKPAQLQAHAYAQGTDIYLASGQEKHLAHEAWHVVQQKQGRVKPTLQMKNKINVNDDPGLEKEADLMGAKAIKSSGISKETSVRFEPLQRKSSIIQRIVTKVWSKWKSSYDPKLYNSKEEAEAFDNVEKLKAQKVKKAKEAAALELAEETWRVAAKTVEWKFSNAGKRLTKHFKDGWGAAYGITSKKQIKDYILAANGSVEMGVQEVYIGDFKNEKTKDVKSCNILYENKMVSISAGGITRNAFQSDIFHCGPSSGAG